MSRSSWLWGTLLAAALVLGLTAERSAAQTVIVGPAPTISYYAAPAVSYSAAPVVSYMPRRPFPLRPRADGLPILYRRRPSLITLPAPTVSYYTPAPVAVTTVRQASCRVVRLSRRATTSRRRRRHTPRPRVVAPSVAGYYSPVYLYP